MPEIDAKLFIGFTNENSLKSPAAMTFAAGRSLRILAMNV